jgi:hypothetical protein
MFGSTRRDRIYYRCAPPPAAFAGAGPHPPGTPKTRWVTEDSLMREVQAAVNTHILSPSRQGRLQGTLEQAQARQHDESARRRRELINRISELTVRQDRLIAQLETGHAGNSALDGRLRQRFDELETQRRDAQRRLDDTTSTTHTPPPPDLSDTLDAGIDLLTLPDDQRRRLFDLHQLQIHYHRPNQIHIRIVMPAPDTHHRT